MKLEKQKATLEEKDLNDAIVLYMRTVHQKRIDPKKIHFVNIQNPLVAHVEFE